MPVYNQARYLAEAIESVRGQTYSDYELIIIDDKSSDNSPEIVQRYAAKDRRIRFQKNAANSGMVNNWNKCLLDAKGEYIKYLFGDDKLESPTALEEMVSVLDVRPDVCLVASARYEIDENSRVLKVLSSYAEGATYRGTDIIRDCIIEQRNLIGEPSAVMFRRKPAVRGFDLRFKQIVDLEMWFHLLEQGAFACIDRPLAAFRIHPEQQTRQNALNSALVDEPFLLLERYSNKPYLQLSWFQKKYMQYVPLYAIWKLYKKHNKMSKQEALKLIGKRTSLKEFMAFYPFFKTYRLFLNTVSNKGRQH